MSRAPGRSKNSELEDLKRDLQDKKLDKKVEAVKKTIGMLNVGKDVSELFFPVMKCLELDSLEIRKLVYLYIIHYSRDRPSDAIMVINSFVKDSGHKSNPMIRALAVRTMGCLRVPDLCPYLVNPLNSALEDKDPYVRKNAALCVPKVYEMDPDLVEKNGILDKTPNAVTALAEVNTLRPEKVKILTKSNFENVLQALGEAPEWGQVALLDYLAENPPKESKNAEIIVDRVLPRLSHINPAVVFSACKVIITYFPHLEKEIFIEGLCKKLAAPLGTLVTGDFFEGIWIVLRGLQVVVLRYPQIFADVKIFFIRYNDPSFVKNEKLSMISALISEKNCDTVLNELNEYAYDMNIEFTTMAVRTIWKTALRISSSLSRVLGILASIVNNVGEGTGQHFIEEILVGYEQIMRRYPKASNYADNVKQIFSKIEGINRADSKVSQLYLLGEYYDTIEDGYDMISDKIDSMAEEELSVQLQILNTAVRIYINNPDNFIEQLANLFRIASENSDNPDLRDRAFIYWRLLNLNDIPLAKEIITGEKPHTVEEEGTGPISTELAGKLIPQLGLITSILWDTEERLGLDIVPFGKEEDMEEAPGTEEKKKTKKRDEAMEKREIDQEDLLGLGDVQPSPTHSNTQSKGPENKGNGSDLLDIGLNDESPVRNQPQKTQNTGGSGGLMDLMDLGMGDDFGGSSNQQSSQSNGLKPAPLEIVLPKMQAGTSGKNGVEISAAVGRNGNQLFLHLQFKNFLGGPIAVNSVSLMPNSLQLSVQNYMGCQVAPNSSQEIKINLAQSGFGQNQYSSMLSAHIVTSYEQYSVAVPIYPHVLADLSRQVTTDEFKSIWGSAQQSVNDQPVIPQILSQEGQLKNLFSQNGINHLSTQMPGGTTKYYFGTRLMTQEIALIEITTPSPSMIGGYQLVIKSQNMNLAKAYPHSIGLLLK